MVLTKETIFCKHFSVQNSHNQRFASLVEHMKRMNWSPEIAMITRIAVDALLTVPMMSLIHPPDGNVSSGKDKSLQLWCQVKMA